MQFQENEYQQTLCPYAYNILGSIEEARDVVGDVLAKHLTNENTASIRNEKTYLTKSVINLAITVKGRQRRIMREGEAWLPEPIATDEAADYNLNLTDILSYSLLVLLERLNATERAVFILRESFEYTHEEIAGALSLSEDNTRQLLRRAKAKLFKPEVRKRVQSSRQKEVLERFLQAFRERDTKRLEELMAADIEFHVDAGGKAPFLRGHCSGAAQVALLQMTIYERYLKKALCKCTTVNHQPALLSFVSGQLRSCQIFDVHLESGAILQIHAVLDPQKLKSFSFR